MEEENLRDLIKDLKNTIENKDVAEQSAKEDNWKMPFFTKLKCKVGKNKIDKGWATIQIVRNNGNVTFTKAQVKDGVAIIDGFPRACSVEHVLFYKRKPFYILPEWSLKPFSAAENYQQTEKERMNIAGRRAVLATLETEKIKTKKDFGSLGWVLVVAVVVGAVWYLGKNQGWF